MGTGRRLGRGEAHVKCQESDTLPSTMKKKVCVILGAGVSAVTRKTSGESPRARRAKTDNRFARKIPGRVDLALRARVGG